MQNPQNTGDGGNTDEPLTWTDSNNLSSSQTSSLMPFAVNTAGSSLTSISGSPKAGDKICRCKMHTDACDRSQYANGAEKCMGCQGYFSWTANAMSCIILTTEEGFLCRCKWHDSACRRLQDDYDARKCVCCRGWLAFSEQANKLIGTPVSNDAAGPIEDQAHLSEFFDFG
jgi:hypothetical protein